MGYREIGMTIPRTGASEWVYQVIRKGITTGEFKGGMQLKQDEISEALSVSHIPVREALRRLESQGLVTIQPNRGAQVATLSRRDILDMMEVRATLSVMALRNSFEHFTEKDFEEMEACASAQPGARNLMEAEEMNYRFHDLLGKYADNAVARLFMGLIHDNIDRYLRGNFYGKTKDRNISASEHRAIVSACREGDCEKACDLLRKHILNANIYIPEDSKLS